MEVPRTLKELLAEAERTGDYERLADWFEFEAEPDWSKAITYPALEALREAFKARVAAEQTVADRVADARCANHSWAQIGAMLGTSGEAARQRYSEIIKPT